jgi:hypothetical protein
MLRSFWLGRVPIAIGILPDTTSCSSLHACRQAGIRSATLTAFIAGPLGLIRHKNKQLDNINMEHLKYERRNGFSDCLLDISVSYYFV